MPVMEGYVHADKPHEKTIINDAYRYGCFNTNRSGVTMCRFQNGWTDDGRRLMIPYQTKWIKTVRCGHITRSSDPHCIGCKNI